MLQIGNIWSKISPLNQLILSLKHCYMPKSKTYLITYEGWDKYVNWVDNSGLYLLKGHVSFLQYTVEISATLKKLNI